MPGYIFEAGIAPFKGFTVRGVIWYQGESNAENPVLYREILPEVIGSFREIWNNTQLPFISAQLSSIQRPGWEKFRDLQRVLAWEIPNTALVVTSDLGDSLNVHPKRKKEVGDRFSYQALNKVYGKTVLCDGPLPQEATKKGESIVVKFKPGQYLATADSRPLRELEVAGEDQIFRPINGKLKDNTILIESDGYKIKQIRYAWKPFTRGNLINREGLPASTFTIVVN
jgi:sialate O-acetylesterase